MKKLIGYVNLDSSSAEKILSSMPESELKSGLTKLIQKEYGSLMVEADSDISASFAKQVITCGELVIEEAARKIERSGEEILLTPKEFDILLFLAKNRGQVFTKEQIYQAVWENGYVMDDSNIMAFIRKIRKKIEPNPDAPIYILTIWGIGYKFSDAF